MENGTDSVVKKFTPQIVAVEEFEVEEPVVHNGATRPFTRRLPIHHVFPGGRKPDTKRLRQHLIGEGRLELDCALKIINMAEDILISEDNMIEISPPVTICGDIHGQFYDLMKLFEVGGDPSSVQYLFLGDYVDRGYFSVEVILYLYSLKICYPRSVHLLRGNHECRHLTTYFTFKKECEIKYGLELYNACMNSFDALPLAALVNKQFLCIHGGLSPDIVTLSDIQQFDRVREPPTFGPFCDILWSDPANDYGDDRYGSDNFQHNHTRGCAFTFSYNAVATFLARNGLLSVIRAHEVQDQGYKMYRHAPTGFPSLITIFSAPNYLDSYHNKAAILKYADNTMNIRQFNSSPHPYWLPNLSNVFQWSLPFAAEKVNNMLLVILKICSDDELNSDEKSDENQIDCGGETGMSQARKRAIKAKIQSVGRMGHTYEKMRKNSETCIELAGITPNSPEVLDKVSRVLDGIHKKNDGRDSLGDSTKERRLSFEEAKELDAVNERIPAVEKPPNTA